MTWNGPESKWLIFSPKPYPIHRSLNLLRIHKQPPSTDETDSISPSEPFPHLSHSAGGCLFPAAAAVPRQFDIPAASRNQCKPPIFEVYPGTTEEPSDCQHYPRPLPPHLLSRSADKTRGSRASP